jgi:hypothetical protein
VLEHHNLVTITLAFYNFESLEIIKQLSQEYIDIVNRLSQQAVENQSFPSAS